MFRSRTWLLISVALLSACSSKDQQKQQPAEATAQPTLHEMMTKRIDPDADAIWAIGNAAIDPSASIDPKKMTDKTWADLEKAAQRMAGHAGDLGALNPVIVTRPGVKIADEGTPGAPSTAEIQAHLARDLDLYRSLAASLADHATRLSNAAQSRDARTAGELISQMDGVCESCHLEFWYPEQKELVEKILKRDAAAGGR